MRIFENENSNSHELKILNNSNFFAKFLNKFDKFLKILKKKVFKILKNNHYNCQPKQHLFTVNSGKEDPGLKPKIL